MSGALGRFETQGEADPARTRLALLVDGLGDALQPRRDVLGVIKNGKCAGAQFLDVLLQVSEDLLDARQHDDQIDAQPSDGKESKDLGDG